MSGKVRVESFSVSLDGYGAGPDQSLEHPMGVGGQALHGWAFETQTFRRMFGQPGGSTDVDDRHARRGFANVGAWVMGRNMFGPVRGPWPDDAWKGWWGDEPPYHCDVFVLTHHPRASFTMAGGTVFHFVTDGLSAALARAHASADGKDVRIGGGVSTIREGLRGRLVDEAHLAVSPVLLGRGESLFAGLDLPALGYTVVEQTPTAHATHVVLRRG
ncbi:MAG: dihydrofolate reductase family protein [Vicinamibacterales bacterium]